MADDRGGVLMRRVLWACTLVLAVTPTVAAARAQPCRARPKAVCEQDLRQYPPPRGLPLLITGGALFLLGIPTTVVGTLLLLEPDPSSPWPNGPLTLAIPGAAMMALGMPMAAVGAVRFDRFLRWNRTWSVAPVAGRTQGGAFTAGVTLRF